MVTPNTQGKTAKVAKVAQPATKGNTQQVTALRTVAMVVTLAYNALFANKRIGAFALYNAVCIALSNGAKVGTVYNAIAAKYAALLAVHCGLATNKATVTSASSKQPNATSVTGCLPLSEVKASGLTGYFSNWVRLAYSGSGGAKGASAKQILTTQQQAINALLPVAYSLIAAHGASVGMPADSITYSKGQQANIISGPSKAILPSGMGSKQPS